MHTAPNANHTPLDSLIYLKKLAEIYAQINPGMSSFLADIDGEIEYHNAQDRICYSNGQYVSDTPTPTHSVLYCPQTIKEA